MQVLEALIEALASEAPATELRVGAFFTAVASHTVGLASTLRNVPHAPGGPPVCQAGMLLPATVGQLASLTRSDSLLEASVGLAALNSAVDVDVESLSSRNAASLLKERGQGRRVAIVGGFPFARSLLGVASDLYVFERGDRVGPGELPAERMPELLPQVEVAAISSTTLLNHTLDEILALLDPGCFRLLVGPSTPLSPVLFDFGFDALCGSLVLDQERVLACVGQGATFRQFGGVRHVVLGREAP
jgi:uncharacterized protein